MSSNTRLKAGVGPHGVRIARMRTWNESYHYPPELTQLLIDTIPLLCRSKNDVLVFFRGAGTPDEFLSDLQVRLARDRSSVNKYEIARTTIERLNSRGDSCLRQRRELLKRVVEFEDFSTCWPNDQLKAKGLVGEVRRVINVKDSFTRINKEREAEREQRLRSVAEQRGKEAQQRALIQEAKSDLYALFGLEDKPQERGILLEKALNGLFAACGILIKENFKRRDPDNAKVIEQIDGVIELDGKLYLVEMKWVAERIGVDLIAQHLVRLFSRADARGLFISTNGFAETAISQCREALGQKVISLCGLDEIIAVLEAEASLEELLRKKIRTAELEKEPFVRVVA